MIAKEILNHSIPSVRKEDVLEDVIGWMEELEVTQLPLVDKGELVGIITSNNIINYNLAEDTAGQVPISHTNVFVKENDHFYEVIRAAKDHRVDIVPVLSETDQVFIGVVCMKDVTEVVAKMFATQHPGGILVLLIDARQYSLAELSRLIEDDNAKILSCFVETYEHDINKLKVTIKVNTQNLTHIVPTLERFNYQIMGKYHDFETKSNTPERLSILFKYLDI